jgi:hypothetical protein
LSKKAVTFSCDVLLGAQLQWQPLGLPPEARLMAITMKRVAFAKCFPCHAPAKDRDYVFTHYAPTR